MQDLSSSLLSFVNSQGSLQNASLALVAFGHRSPKGFRTCRAGACMHPRPLTCVNHGSLKTILSGNLFLAQVRTRVLKPCCSLDSPLPSPPPEGLGSPNSVVSFVFLFHQYLSRSKMFMEFPHLNAITIPMVKVGGPENPSSSRVPIMLGLSLL